MKKPLAMRADTPYVLNFLIYLQNIYLNQRQREEHLKFPYLSEMIMFHDDFEDKFKVLWEELLDRLSKDEANGTDLEIFYDESNLFYEKLFIPNSDSLKTYNEIYIGFRVWWSSLAGGFSVERSIDDPIYNIYIELSNSLKKNEIKPKKQLKINLIYDECVLTNTYLHSHFAVISIKAFLDHQQDLVSKLQKCLC
ncbi:hypothetical protein ABE096_07510 [Robertmurraya massiliosenegalensis]|uniref:hypothetical protein n=1 Tax=Robertmurraya TaxID=2837507 RepID=UPI0039A61E08